MGTFFEILKYATSDWMRTGFTLIVLFYIFRLIDRIYFSIIHYRSIKVNGYPPVHCDALGKATGYFEPDKKDNKDDKHDNNNMIEGSNIALSH